MSFGGGSKIQQPYVPTKEMLAAQAQLERKKLGTRQGYQSTILSMGMPLNKQGPKTILGG
jgi:hypothetical protein